ncbi:MAG TPA: hypothetical protein IAB62_02885 [Candidatus Coprocola pullicola]|nr:hypothetical protein [Candidatus Coprocola pullicola]
MIRSSFAGFTTAKLGMSASQSALNVIGQNISNINVQGYTRQRVDLASFNGTTGPRQWGNVNDTFIGNGVVVNKIEQVRDPYLDLRFRTEMTSVGYFDETLGCLNELQSVLDEVNKTGSIHNQLEAVLEALNEFNPQAANNEFQNMVKTEMQLLTQYFNNYSNRIQQAKEDNMKEFKEQTVPAVNELLKQISDLNKSIRENEIMGNPALELRDQRNNLLDELSGYVKIEVTYEEKNIGLSSNTVEECTVKLIGTDGNGNPYKYTLVDNDKAVSFSVNDDCSQLTMTDINGNPIADIGSALKPANGVVGTFTQAEADAINNLIVSIKNLSIEVQNQMKEITKYNQEISSYLAKINSLNSRGNTLHSELRDTLKLANSNQNAIDDLNTRINEILTEDPTADVSALREELAKKENVQKIYNQKLYGQDTKPANLGELNALDPNGDGIYNKLIKIYGPITDDTTQPPTYQTPAQTGDLFTAKQNLEQAQQNLETAKTAYSNAINDLRVYIDGGTDSNGVVVDGLSNYANITVEYNTIPVDGTNYFISLPTITLTGTSARDGEGIRLFDGELLGKPLPGETTDPATGKVTGCNMIQVNGGEVTITDIRGVEYTEQIANIDGTPYQYDIDPATGTAVIKTDIDGNPIVDAGDQRNMYHYMQEDSGRLKADLDMFNRSGEFNSSDDRGYDYYINMLDTMVRQIAKVFNSANIMDADGNILVDADGNPLSYANALFGANGEVPAKYMTDANGNYIDYAGNPLADGAEPLYDIFKRNENGELLDANGNVTTDIADAAFDPAAMAALGFKQVKETGTDNNGTPIQPGDFLDENGNKIDFDQTSANPTDPQPDWEPLEGKVPKIDYDKITAENFTITTDWAEGFTNLVQTHDPSQTAGYNDNINHLISQFSEKLDYTFTTADGTQKKIFNGTFVEFFDNVSNQLGLDIRSSTVLTTNYITVANDIANSRDSVSGVSMDEEGISILQYQKSYNAAARLMTALDEALETVINNMGLVGR